jgi:gluconate 2-dehydrogenase gamma chain
MNKLLQDWDNSLNGDQHRRLDQSLTRRQFLLGSAKTITALSLSPALLSLSACSKHPPVDQQALIQHEPWRTFAAVQQQLFPDDGNGPSAKDLNATLYLKFVLDAKDTDPDDRRFIDNGITWLNDLAQQTHQHTFVTCTPAQQSEVLTDIAKSRAGERWLAFLLTYIFEALLTDPVYGGNPNGIGWQWLQHQPGFPHPPKDKQYTELLKS